MCHAAPYHEPSSLGLHQRTVGSCCCWMRWSHWKHNEKVCSLGGWFGVGFWLQARPGSTSQHWSISISCNYLQCWGPGKYLCCSMLEKEGVLSAFVCRFIIYSGKEKSRSHFRDAKRPSPPITYAAPSLHTWGSQGVRSGPEHAVLSREKHSSCGMQ